MKTPPTIAEPRSTLTGSLRAFFAQGFRPQIVTSGEWFLTRLLFAAVVFHDLLDPANFRYASLEKPHGLAAWFHGTPLDLTWLAHDGVRPIYLSIAAVAALGYLLTPLLTKLGSLTNLIFPLSATVLLIAHILPRTVQNSQGSIHHSHQVIGLILLAQSVLAWLLWARARRRQNAPPQPPAAGSEPSLFAYYSLGILMASYLSAGLSKLFNSKGLWIWNAPWISFDLIKSQRQAYYKKLEPIYLGGTELAQWVLHHPWLARGAFAGAFFLELLALLALKNRAWAFAIGLALIALHLGIWALMHLEFQAHLHCLIIFAILPAIYALVRRFALPAPLSERLREPKQTD